MIRKMWKKKPQTKTSIQPPLVPTAYPSGVAVFDGVNTYFIKNNKKYRIISERAVKSWGFKVWYGSPESLSKIVLGGILAFRDGSVIKDVSNGKIYLVVNGMKQHITTPDFFTKFGVNPEYIIEVSAKEADYIKMGSL